MEKVKDTSDLDLDNDGVADRFDSDFRDSKTMTYGDLDEREDNRAENDYIGDGKVSLLAEIKGNYKKFNERIRNDNERQECIER
ncbi:MAG TPA: hypothetical protein GX708_22535 [Gallicola sp.]|nr:hypothetical protein [Gallicola sp.]